MMNNYVIVYHVAVDECQTYKNLSDTERNIKNNAAGRACDNGLVTGDWYRFTGSAGTRMIDYCPDKTCMADYHAWINSQPQLGEVKVQRTVCVQGNGLCCNWPKNVTATYCGNFIVYQLVRLNCYVRYCSRD